MGIKTVNDQVALAPFDFTVPERKVRGLDLTDALSATLISTTVVLDSKSYKVGQKLYFKNEVRNNANSRAIVKLEGKDLILLPENLVIAVEG